MHRSLGSSSSYSKDRWARQHWRRSFVPVTQSHFFARSNLNGVRYVICFKSSSPKWQPLSQPSLFPKFQPSPTGQKWQQAWVTSTNEKACERVYVNHYQLFGKSAFYGVSKWRIRIRERPQFCDFEGPTFKSLKRWKNWLLKRPHFCQITEVISRVWIGKLVLMPSSYMF